MISSEYINQNFLTLNCKEHLEIPNIDNPCICMMQVGSVYVGTTGRIFIRQVSRNNEICRITDWGEVASAPIGELADNYLLNAVYNSTTNILTLTMVNEDVITIDMNDLVDPPSSFVEDILNGHWTHNDGSDNLTEIYSVSGDTDNIINIGSDGGALLTASQLCALVVECDLGLELLYDEETNEVMLVDSNTEEIISLIQINNVSLIDNNDGTLTFTDMVGNVNNIELKKVEILETSDGVFSVVDDFNNTTIIDTTDTLTELTITNCILTYTDENGTNNNIDLTECVTLAETLTTISYSGGTISYIDEDGTQTDLEIGVENFLSAVSYDDITNELTFTLVDNSEFTVLLTDLVDSTFIDVIDTATINLTIVGSGSSADPFEITGYVNISADANNKLEEKADGLYVDTRIRVANDFTDNHGAGTNLFPIVYDHTSGKFTLNDIIATHVGLSNPHSQYLLSSAYTAADILTKLLTVDGSGSLLDADLLDGLSSSGYLKADGSIVGATGQDQIFNLNVGIGTNTPTPTVAGRQLLHISDAVNDAELRITGNGGDGRFFATTIIVGFGSINATDVAIQTNNITRVTIDTNGNAALTGDLDIAGNFESGDSTNVNSTFIHYGTATFRRAVTIGTAADSATATINLQSNTGFGSLINVYRNASQRWAIAFNTNDNITFSDATGPTVRFVYTLAGLFGIGTNTTPTAFLDINAGTTANAQIRLRTSVAPTSPNTGDIWADASNLYYRASSATYSIGATVATTKLKPLTDSTNAIGFYKADGTTQDIWYNSTNGYFGIGKLPTVSLHIATASGPTALRLEIIGSGAFRLGLSNGNTFRIADDDTLATNVFMNIERLTGRIGLYGITSPTAFLHIPASTTTNASLRIPSGTAPTSPNDGDIWYDGTSLIFRDSSASRTIATLTNTQTFTNKTLTSPIITSSITFNNLNPSLVGDGTAFGYWAYAYVSGVGGGSQNAFLRADGTLASPSAVTAGMGLGSFSFRGHNGSGFTGSKALIGAYTSEDWTGTANGTYLSFQTTANGTTTLAERLVINNLGYIGVSVAGPTAYLNLPAGTTAAASLRINSGVAPTSPNTGDLWASAFNVFFRSSGGVWSFGETVSTTRIKPNSDSTNAIAFLKADGTTQQMWYNTTNGYFGIGILPTSYLHVSGAFGTLASGQVAETISFNGTGTGHSDGTSILKSFVTTVQALGANNVTEVTGYTANVYVSSTAGTVSSVNGVSVALRMNSAAATAAAYGFRSIPILSSTGSTTAYISFEARTPSLTSTGTIATSTGVYIAQQKITGVTTGRGLWQVGSTDINSFGGLTAFGSNNTPTAFIHIAASTTTNAALRIAAGSSPTTPNAGDIWYLTADRLKIYRAATETIPSGVTGSAFTQTYSTATRTIGAYTSDPESSAYNAGITATAGPEPVVFSSPVASQSDLNLLRVAYENLRVLSETTIQALNAVIDDLQAFGISG